MSTRLSSHHDSARPAMGSASQNFMPTYLRTRFDHAELLRARRRRDASCVEDELARCNRRSRRRLWRPVLAAHASSPPARSSGKSELKSLDCDRRIGGNNFASFGGQPDADKERLARLIDRRAIANDPVNVGESRPNTTVAGLFEYGSASLQAAFLMMLLSVPSGTSAPSVWTRTTTTPIFVG